MKVFIILFILCLVVYRDAYPNIRKYSPMDSKRNLWCGTNGTCASNHCCIGASLFLAFCERYSKQGEICSDYGDALFSIACPCEKGLVCSGKTLGECRANGTTISSTTTTSTTSSTTASYPTSSTTASYPTT